MTAELGATRSRILNRLSYDLNNKATSLAGGVASGDLIPISDVSADGQIKYATPQDIKLGQATGRIVTTVATVLAMTLTQHGERILLINTNSSGTSTFTLPAATGSGAIYKLINGLAQTQGTLVVNTTSVFAGKVAALDSTAAADAMVFKTSATSNTITMNRTTQGGIGYDTIEAIDIVAGTYFVDVVTNGSGSLITPFSGA